MPSAYPYFRSLIRALREKMGWTQEQLAERAGGDYKYYQLLEIGRTATPALATVEKLAKVFGLKPWVLLCDDPKLIAAATKLDPTAFTKPVKPKPGRPRKKVQ